MNAGQHLLDDLKSARYDIALQIMHSFISYSSKDREIADTICAHLEERNVSCWMAPRDIPPGSNYSEEISDGISKADSLVLVLSENANLSRHVLAEVESAFSQLKAVFPVRIRDVKPAKGLKLFIAGSQWIDALEYPLNSKMNELALAIQTIATGGKPSPPNELDCDYISSERKDLSNRLSGVNIVDVATNIVATGETGLDFAPISRFGHLEMADPSEAKQALAMDVAVKRHIQKSRGNRPISLGLFAPPGSGEIFTMEQIIRNAGLISSVNFEMDFREIQDPKEVIHHYRNAQDAALRGKTAVLYFRNFDVPLDGKPFGWIQHFISLMLAGEFADQGVRRPIGPCVLCFTTHESQSYHHLKAASTGLKSGTTIREFLSNLNGYIDLPGINPKWSEDQVYMLDRALYIRAFLRAHKKDMEPALIRSLLNVDTYYNGGRSLYAIIEASCANEQNDILTEDSLPTDAELNLHTDAGSLRNVSNEGNF